MITRKADQPRPRILLFGPRGQVGWEMARTLAPLGEIRLVDRDVVDLRDGPAIRRLISTATPSVIVNAAAYTSVDRAESDPEVAMQINGEAPAAMAAEARNANALLVHFSTDYVFDGRSDRPYTEDDRANPVTAYGASKLAGDERILESGAQAYIFRIGWVYASRGQNFLQTMRRLAAERDELRVVADQRGSPTWARAIAETTTLAVSRWLGERSGGSMAPSGGVYHMAAPDHTTWFDFASAIIAGLPPEARRPLVTPIEAKDYPTPAQRPAWSVLESRRLREAFGLELPSWRTQLAMCIEQV